MKKVLFIISVFLCYVVLISPVPTYAATYNLSETDMSICVDDSIWYVFTRDNLEGNAELEELGLSYAYMNRIFMDNNAYMDALLFVEDSIIEMQIIKNTIDSDMVNLSNYTTEEILDLGKRAAQEKGCEKYTLYENQYKFIKFESVNTENNVYVCDFITCVNKNEYCIKFISENEFTEQIHGQMENIVDSIQFEVDPNLKEPEKSSSAAYTAMKTIAMVTSLAGIITLGIFKVKYQRRKIC